jgi:hypothetical protein
MNFELTSFLLGDIESAVQVQYMSLNSVNLAICNYCSANNKKFHLSSKHLQSCATLEQQELLEEMANSVGVAKV